MSDEIRNAATAVVLRDTDQGLEVLLLRRHAQLKVGGGSWVFPGGTVDDADHHGTDCLQQAARHAAVRETREEADLRLDPATLQLVSHWTTPKEMGRRFATWFFLTGADDIDVTVDGNEMDAYHWGQPREFIDSHRARELAMMPPTLVTLAELAHCDSIDEAKAFYSAREIPFIEPNVCKHLGSLCMLYRGDAGYDTSDPAMLGPRNRCYLEDGVWRYEYFCA